MLRFIYEMKSSSHDSYYRTGKYHAYKEKVLAMALAMLRTHNIIMMRR